jgi:hypothetical protein
MSLFVVSLKSNLTFPCTSLKTCAKLPDFPNATLNFIGLKIASSVTQEFQMRVVPMLRGFRKLLRLTIFRRFLMTFPVALETSLIRGLGGFRKLFGDGFVRNRQY